MRLSAISPHTDDLHRERQPSHARLDPLSPLFPLHCQPNLLAIHIIALCL
jgi:hypothetical protein